MGIITAEYFFEGAIYYLVIAACVILVITNLTDTRKLLKAADERDEKEKKEKADKHAEENRKIHTLKTKDK